MSLRYSIYGDSGGGWTVAYKYVWIPGIYDSPETALKAVTYSDSELGQIRDVWEVTGNNRPATIDDLDRIKKEDNE